MDTDLKQQLEELQKEHNTLKREHELLKLKTSSPSTETRHSTTFWQDIEQKLQNDTNSIKSLIKDGTITMDDVRYDGVSLLHLAAFRGNYEVTKLCINLGADIYRKCNQKPPKTALEWARQGNAHHTAQLLLFNEMEANIGDRIKDLSANINQQNGVVENILNEVSLIGEQTKELFYKTITEITTNIIQKKVIFSDDLLTLSWNLEQQKPNPFKSELWQTITKTCKDIIQNHNKRDWIWLKECMLKSNIWYTEIDDIQEEKTDSDKDKKYLYYRLLSMVKEESNRQLDELKTNLETDIARNETAWDKLSNFDVNIDKLTELKTINGIKPRVPRQDNIPNGIMAQYTQHQLIHNASNINFDAAKFYDHNQYLSKLSLLAQIVDDEFQKSVQNAFNIDKDTNIGTLQKGIHNDDIKYEDDDGISILYKRGPIKRLERARNKTENDYFGEVYPKSGCILDLNRCSLIFNKIDDLLFSLELFINKVRSYQSGSIIGVVRCKNGFKEYIATTQYADIKLNVLIRGNTNNIVGEIQFLLNTMVNYKQKAHKLYAIQRDEDFISQSVSKLLPILTNDSQQHKIHVSMGDINGLCQFMVCRNKTEKDIMIVDKERNRSILIPITKLGKVEMYKYVLSFEKPEIMHHLFFETSGRTPFERAIRGNYRSLIEEMLKLDDFKKKYKEMDEWKYRLLYHMFTYGNLKTIDYVLNEMKFSNEKLIELLTMYIYPKITTNYFKQRIITQTVWRNKLSVLQKLADIMGEEIFTQKVFDDDNINKNALEIAIEKNKMEMMRYLMSFTEIHQKCLNDKDIRWRLVFHLIRNIKTANITLMIEYMMKKLEFNEENLKQIQSHKVQKPNVVNEYRSSFKYWNRTISEDDIKTLLTLSTQQ